MFLGIKLMWLLAATTCSYALTIRPSDESEQPLAVLKISEPLIDSSEDLDSSYAISKPTRIDGKSGNLVEEKFKPADPYSYGFDVKDDYGNRHFRNEQSDGQGTIRGSYGYTDALGLYRIVEYVADASGFRANVKTNEPGLSNNSPANIAMTAQDPPEEVIRAASAPRPAVRDSPKLTGSSSIAYKVQADLQSAKREAKSS